MPYTVRKRDGAFQVVNISTGRVYAKHTTKANAVKQVAALKRARAVGEKGRKKRKR